MSDDWAASYRAEKEARAAEKLRDLRSVDPLAPRSSESAASLAAEYAELHRLQITDPHSPEFVWTIQQLENLSNSNPDNAIVASHFAGVLHIFAEYDLDRAALQRKLDRLASLADRFPRNESVLTGVVMGLGNAAQSDWAREQHPDLSDAAGAQLERIAVVLPDNRAMAVSLALHWQDLLRREVEPESRKGLKLKITDLHAKFPQDQSITDVYQLVTRPKGGCYVATAVYGSYDTPEVWTLRRFRDRALATTRSGRLIIHIYYAISPTLVRGVGHMVWFSYGVRPILDRVVTRLNRLGYESTPYTDASMTNTAGSPACSPLRKRAVSAPGKVQ